MTGRFVVYGMRKQPDSGHYDGTGGRMFFRTVCDRPTAERTALALVEEDVLLYASYVEEGEPIQPLFGGEGGDTDDNA